MFEFDQYDSRSAIESVQPTEPIVFATGICKRSFLHWSEHCIECAAPECYQTCDLYKARPDERCRRFDAGTRRNTALVGETGISAEIVFDRWGKLEARGNAVLIRNRYVNVIDNYLPRVLPVVNAVGRLVRRLGGSPPWTSLSFELLDYTSKKLQKWPVTGLLPDGFLIEIYNPADQPCQMKFSSSVTRSKMLSVPAKGNIPLPFWKQLVLEPGYNRFFIEYPSLSAVVESGFPYNLSFTPEAESGTHLVFITTDFVTLKESIDATASVITPVFESRPNAKCVVFDLDDTLWDGVLVEGQVTLKPRILAVLKELDQRGILMSIASKNNEQEALQKLKELGVRDYFIYPVINWRQKSDNIKLMASHISIGVDTLVFIDDNPFEREEVATAVPSIEVLPETAIDSLLDHPRLKGSGTTEAGIRRVMYQQQIRRGEELVEFGDDYLAFLRACNIVVTFGLFSEKYRERVVELLQRTNQLNFSGNKYTREAIIQLLQDTSMDKHVIHCSDKYGDYGLVGFSLTRAEVDRVHVVDFMLSCRVQGKLIDKAFFNYLAEKYINNDGVLEVNFVLTDRNLLAKAVLEEIGFSMTAQKGATLQVEPGRLDTDFLVTRSQA